MTKLKNRTARAIGAGLLALAAPAALVAPAVPAAAAENRLDSAVKALRAIGTMKASFRQIDRSGQQVSGTMTLKRPGKIRFQYQDSVPLLIVSDGSRLTMLDYEVNQKQVWPIKNSPLGALLQPDGDISRFGTLMPTSHKDVTSIRIKDPKHPEYGTMTMIFEKNASAPGGMELAGWVSVDAQNKTTKILLDNHRYGMTVSNGTFMFKDVRARTKR
ncbi:outer membrane lipoprotein carrier protein LolA [Croceicoccus ponticola]|uniref:Outer membrane lipoprotein carrier protein LolA n=1 Tax=Croceicoccus ponticola TaxID=2217664 RepID=A0A437GZ46_9SPHN|nr:outer membrane lipoprotein carrier protein LolA [Croceicoccus ponticola]RVQ67615.1 outer membrane lipoprotein carrier protein LolA [Croceicoccus ponticola]